MISKTIICKPEDFDEKFNTWVVKKNKEYRDSLNEDDIHCHKNWFEIVIEKITHDGDNHYISYYYNDGGMANMPDDL